MKYVALTLILATTLLSGCAYKAAPYGASVNNVEILKAKRIKPVAVSPFTSTKPGLASIGCRGAGTVDVTPSFEKYIENALIDELKLAGAYNPNSNITIKGKLEEIDFSSGMSDGNWTIVVTISNGKNQSFSTKSIYTFSGSFVADKACSEVAQYFVQAVQKLIKEIVQNPKFKQITTS